MSQTFVQIQRLVADGQVRISLHGYEQLAEDGLLAGEVLAGIPTAEIVEDYPEYPKGPCVLVLQQDSVGAPVHVVWGIPKGKDAPAVLVTAYRPDPERWTSDYKQRRS